MRLATGLIHFTR